MMDEKKPLGIDQDPLEGAFWRHYRLVEALLFATSKPLGRAELVAFLGEGADLDQVLDRLVRDYKARGVNLVHVGERWAFRTAPDVMPYLQSVIEAPRKLSRAAMETLAVIAYHQPVTRSEIEAIRGVATGKGTLDHLMEIGWIAPGRRKETPGRPLTWQTTQAFLDHFTLSSLKDLPGVDDLRAAGLLDARSVLSSLGDIADDLFSKQHQERRSFADEDTES